MEVASCVLPPSGDRGDDGASAPFRQRRHDVREWQRVDCQTGAYARARFEADRRRWTTNGDDGDSDGHAHARFNHHYGKLVDSLLRTDPRNGLREAASRQLVVFRSQGPVGGSGGGTGGGTVHVVRTRTSLMMASCTSSTTTSWTGPNDANAATAEAPTPPTAPAANDGSLLEDFHNLQLSVNPLDVTAEKSKAVVCRSASRRPPTRQRSHRRRSPQQPTSDAGGGVATPSGPPSHTAIAAANLHRVSRLCHQIHASAVRQAFGTAPAAAANVSLQTRTTSTSTPTPPKREADADAPTANTTVEIVELESSSSDNTNTAPHTNLVRTKSSSNEDIHLPSETSNSMNKSIEDLDDLEQLQTWRRTSKIRRSLQFPKQNRQKSSSTRKPVDIPENSVSVKKIKEDLEKGRRLDTVLRNNSVDLEALDQILQSISGGSSSDKSSVEAEADTEETYKKQKRNSFVTVESIQEVKGRLRRTSSPSSDIYKENGKDEDLDADDGIVVEETCSINGCDCGCDGTEAAHPKTEETSRVKSYVYGMEAALLNKKPAGIRTGSLGSRVKLVNGNFNAKNEDWYNRRKSYGFEQVQTQEDSSNCTLESKKQVESSTDSGICRSSEIVTKTTNNNPYNENHSIVENDQDHKLNGWKEITTGQVKKLASTYDSNGSRAGESGPGQTWSKPLELKSTTITIPIVKNNNVVDLPWYDHGGGGGAEIKRHSIAVDESRYVRRAGQQQQQQQPIQDRRQRRTSLVSPVATVEPFEDEANAAAAIRRIKKVEFCKTEVHFAAESGKVNIVATDEKPPPTQNFRRRRRNSSSGPPADELAGSGGGLPVLRFGDSSEEQNMFGLTADVGAAAAPRICATTSPRLHRRRDVDADARPPALPAPPVAVVVVDAPTDRRNVFGVVTVNADDVGVVVACCQNDATATADATQGNTDEPSENEIKGILKNKPIPPIPYHLGEEASPTASPAAAAAAAAPASPIVTYPSSSSDEETSKWGVKLRHVEKQQPQPPPVLEGPSSIWKSTVTVRNFYEKNGQDGRGKGKEGEVGEGGSAGAATQEFQKRLRSLRPTKKGTPVAADSSCDTKRNCWSVEEGGGGTEHRGYSTKINFGEGEATVVEDDDRRWGRQGNTTWPRLSEELPDKDSASLLHRTTNSISNIPSAKVTAAARDEEEPSTPRRGPSPFIQKVGRSSPPPVRPDLTPVEKLSSPSLVGKTGAGTAVDHHKLHPNHIAENIVLRQPKRSEMTYFGIKVSPSPKKKVSQDMIRRETKLLSEKPDLLQHHAKSTSPTRSKYNKPRQKTPEPIYENVQSDKKYKESITKKRTVDGKTTATATAKAMTTTTERQQQGVQQTKKKQDKSDSSTSSKATAAANLKASRRLQRASSREALLHSHGSSSEDLPNRTEVAVRKPRLVKKTKAVQLTMTNGLELKKKPNSIRSSGGSTAARKKEDRATTGKADERILNSLPEIRHKTAVSTIRSTSEKVTKDRPKYKHEDIKKKMPTKKDTTSRGATMAAVTAETATTATVTATATPTCSDSQCNRSAPAPVPVHHSSVPPSSTGSKQCSTAPGTPDKAATAKDRHRRRGNDHQHQSSIATASVPTVVTQHRISTANIKKCSSSRSEGVKP